MTINEALFSPVREPLMGVFYLLLTAQMAVVFASFREERGRAYRTAAFLHLALSLILFYPVMYRIDWKLNFNGPEPPLPGWLAAFSAWPAAVIVVYEAVSAGILAVVLADHIRYLKTHPTAFSIKETMDLLPAGIAFSRPEGTVAFRNLTMRRLARALTGRMLTDMNAFRRVAGLTGAQAEKSLRLPDGSAVWQFSWQTLAVDGEVFQQLTASDITGQAKIAAEREETNRKLRELQMRLQIYNRQADRVIMEQELLNARMAVHNELGSVLLESRHYLCEPEAIREDVLLQALKNTNTYLLREYEQDDTAWNALRDALETAETIGVAVEAEGSLPVQDPDRRVVAAAIIECATNAVKHAGGDALHVSAQEEDGRMVYVFVTNGAPPDGTVKEAGGLVSLRRLVEGENGQMAITSAPRMTLTITMPQQTADIKDAPTERPEETEE